LGVTPDDDDDDERDTFDLELDKVAEEKLREMKGESDDDSEFEHSL